MRAPHDAQFLQERANFLWRLGRRAEAERVAREAIAQDPEMCTAAWIVDQSQQAYTDCTAREWQKIRSTRASR